MHNGSFNHSRNQLIQPLTTRQLWIEILIVEKIKMGFLF
jgi:hypothetical protein